jgi:hypothetical protein
MRLPDKAGEEEEADKGNVVESETRPLGSTVERDKA